MRPKLLDLFCGAGGCAVGYHRAGFDVVAVDNRPMPRYPYEFSQEDAIEFLRRHGSEFDVIHASPPCQKFSAMVQTGAGKDKPDLIKPVRELLIAIGKPYVIENVERAPLHFPTMLCGTMFGLRVRRHRIFECQPWLILSPGGCCCRNGVRDGRLVGQMLSGKVAPGRTPRVGYTESQRREAIGVPWMTTMEARQAIPPAYTEYIGRQIMRIFKNEADTGAGKGPGG